MSGFVDPSQAVLETGISSTAEALAALPQQETVIAAKHAAIPGLAERVLIRRIKFLLLEQPLEN
jgi:hypothetical protein